jgi:hypothetical protein
MRPVRRADILATFMFRLTQDPRILNLLKPLRPIYALTGIVYTFTKTRKAPCKITCLRRRRRRRRRRGHLKVIM